MATLKGLFLRFIFLGILLYCGIFVNRALKTRFNAGVPVYTSLSNPPQNIELPNKYEELELRHDTLGQNELLGARKESSMVDYISRGSSDRPLKNNLNIAVFTSNPYWVLKLGLNQADPLVYTCAHSQRTLSIWSAYHNITMTRDADIVIFSRSIDHRLWEQVLAEPRSRHQVWVYGSAESAYKSPQVREGDRPVGFGPFRFNMSFGYYSKDNVVAPFGEYIPFVDVSGQRKTKKENFSFSKLKKKTKLVAWTSSHCDNQQWNRTGFVQTLSNFVSIDKFGECGNLTLRFGDAASRKLKTYKFYLALENSCCSEYITEKFWQALGPYQTVPIVVGASRQEYEKVAPPNSFIFADDFDSISDLAKYLRRVASDDELYDKFHQWRREGTVKLYTSKQIFAFTSQKAACNLLKFLEKYAWKQSGHLEMNFDPFGPEWLGSCNVCGNKEWLRSYDLNSDAYNSTLRAENKKPENTLKHDIEKHRRRISREYMSRLGMLG